MTQETKKRWYLRLIYAGMEIEEMDARAGVVRFTVPGMSEVDICGDELLGSATAFFKMCGLRSDGVVRVCGWTNSDTRQAAARASRQFKQMGLKTDEK